MDEAIKKQLAQADRLALQARAAAMAGNKKRAADLLRQFDLLYIRIYSQLEARADVGQEVTRTAQELKSPLERPVV